ncbi:hypothetical protein ACFYO2_17090 [Streptomyces sp. NPDC006602]|uniref:hypothetical protein n=1 Tax=Streptomyces sp. NPDC006602 TaxID=3364751 RepID=UPI00369485C5
MKSLLSSQPSTTMDTPTETPYESDLAPLLTAWDVTHSPVADPEWRHLLDELAHPHTTQAFQRLAATTS